jgi:hypothetical protein
MTGHKNCLQADYNNWEAHPLFSILKEITYVLQMSVTNQQGNIKISLVQRLITNLNVILYLSTCHTIYVSLLILFMIMS